MDFRPTLPTLRIAQIRETNGVRVMPDGRSSAFNSFNCPNCNAFYEVVKVEPGPETVDREINCRSCGTPLPGRDGNLVLKYFMLRKAERVQRAAAA